MLQMLTACPIVRAEELTLYGRVEVGGTTQFVPFTRRILWCRMSESAIVLRHGSCDVETRGCYSDYHGYLTSVEGAIEDVFARLAEYDISPGDKLRLEIDVVISDIPLVPDESPEAVEHNRNSADTPAGERILPRRKKRYLHIPSDRWWFLDDQEDPRTGARPILESVIVVPSKTILTTADQSPALSPAMAAWVENERAAARATCSSPSPSSR